MLYAFGVVLIFLGWGLFSCLSSFCTGVYFLSELAQECFLLNLVFRSDLLITKNTCIAVLILGVLYLENNYGGGYVLVQGGNSALTITSTSLSIIL